MKVYFCSEMLEQSLGELQLTVDELEKRIEGLDDESMSHHTTSFNC